MSIYYCQRCGRNQDNDYVLCAEDPVNGGLMCEEHKFEEGEPC